MNFKKLLAIVLVLAMVMSFMPTMAFADDEDVVTEPAAEEPAAEEPVVEEPDEGEDLMTDEPPVNEEPEEDLNGAVGVPPVKFMFDGTELHSCDAKAKTVDEVVKFYVADSDITAAKAEVAEKLPGYHFNTNEWRNTSGAELKIDEANAFTVTDVTATLVVVADLAKNTYAVTYKADPTSLTNKLPVNETVEYNDHPVAKMSDGSAFNPAAAITGYTFDGFYVNGQKIGTRIDAITVTAATEVTVKWVSSSTDTHKVVFNYNGADSKSIVGPVDTGTKDVRTITVSHGAKVAASEYNKTPTNEANHKTFVEWTPSVTGYTPESEILTDVTFTAKWTDTVFTVEFVGYPDKTQTGVVYGSTVSTADPEPATGSHDVFSGWSLTEDGDLVPLASHPITENTKFYPIWNKETKTVSFNLDGGKGTTAAQFADQKVVYGGKAKDPGEPTRLGYHFTGWTAANAQGQYEPFTFDTAITADTTVKANWAGNNYLLYVDASAITGTVKYGSAVLSNPVAKIMGYDATNNKSFAAMEKLSAEGYSFEAADAADPTTYAPYVWKYVDTAGTTVTVPVQVGNALELNENMTFVPTDNANEYKVTLTAVPAKTFWNVKFDTSKATTGVTAPDDQRFTNPATATDARTINTSLLNGIVEGNIVSGTVPNTTTTVNYYVDGWYTTKDFTTKWNMKDNVTSNLTLYAKLVPFQKVTFTLREGEFDPNTDPKVRYVPKGMSLTDAKALQTKYSTTFPTWNNYSFELPKAVKAGAKLTWMNATTPFTAASVVNSDLTITDSWEDVKWTVTYNPNGGTLKDVDHQDVVDGKTIAVAPQDPVLENNIFDGWYYGTNLANEFVFGAEGTGTAVTKDMELKAKWTEAEAKIGTDLYATLQDAVDAAASGDEIKLVKDVTLTGSITTIENVVFNFDGFTVSGGTIESNGKVTVKGGTFDQVRFVGDVTVTGGTFLKNTFDGTPKVTVTAGSKAKFDETTARYINKNGMQLPDTAWLAVTASSTDGYYTSVTKAVLTFNDGTSVLGQVKIGAGETPNHAIKEAKDAETITPAQYKAITEVKKDGSRFVEWRVGTTALPMDSAYTGADATVTAAWQEQWTVTFIVNGATTNKTVAVDKGKKVEAWDPSAVIAELNKNRDATDQDEFDYWRDDNGVKFDFTKPVTDNITLTAVMKVKVLFDYQDVGTATKLLQVAHGVKLDEYKKAIPAAPDGSDNWIDWNKRILDLNTSFEYRDYPYDYQRVEYYPHYVGNQNWNIIEAYPSSGISYDAEKATITYQGSKDDPILMSTWIYSDDTTLSFQFCVEAPATVKSTDKYEIQQNGGAWRDLTFNGTSVNNNQRVWVTDYTTFAKIKDAAKSGQTLSFTFAIREKDAEKPCASWTVVFDPSNVKFTNTTAYNDKGDFLICEGKFEYALSYGDQKAQTVEYGKKIVLPANPTSTTGGAFEKWVGDNGSEFLAGYTDKDGHYDPDPNPRPAALVEGTSVYGGFAEKVKGSSPVTYQDVRNYFFMTEDVAFTAKWTDIPVAVGYSENGYETWDKNTYVASDAMSKVVKGLPTPTDYTGKVFTGYEIRKTDGTDYVPFDPTTLKDTDLAAKYMYTDASTKEHRILIRAVYADALSVTFKDNQAELLVTKAAKPAPIQTIKFYTDGVKQIEDSMEFFQFWTTVKPRADGTWANKPAEFKFDEATSIDADTIVYAYAPIITWTVKAHAVGSEKATEIKVVDGKTAADELAKLAVEGQAGWTKVDPKTGKDPTTAVFAPDTKITENVEIWAYMKTFKITYDANSGSDPVVVPDSQTKVYGVDVKLSEDKPVRTGRTFFGWATSKDATKAEFQPGDNYDKNADLTLYAVWNDPVVDFVERAYEVILGRPADEGGLENWVGDLKSGKETGANLISGFIRSAEFKEKGKNDREVVTILYNAMLDRAPDAEGLANWITHLANGVTYDAIVNGFAVSNEFGEVCAEYGITAGTVQNLQPRDVNPLLTGFVNRNYLYALNRAGEEGGLNTWAKELLDKVKTPKQVAKEFVFSGECLARDLNDKLFVEMLYGLFMNRTADEGGLEFWVAKLESGEMTREQVTDGFADSDEFAAIVASYGL